VSRRVILVQVPLGRKVLEVVLLLFPLVKEGVLEVLAIGQNLIRRCFGGVTLSSPEFEHMKLSDLKEMAKNLGIKNLSKYRKDELIQLIEDQQEQVNIEEKPMLTNLDENSNENNPQDEPKLQKDG